MFKFATVPFLLLHAWQEIHDTIHITVKKYLFTNAVELEKAVWMQNGNHAGSKKHDHKLSHVILWPT